MMTQEQYYLSVLASIRADIEKVDPADMEANRKLVSQVYHAVCTALGRGR